MSVEQFEGVGGVVDEVDGAVVGLDRQPEQGRPADHDGARAQRQRPDHVAALADAAVEEDLGLAADRGRFVALLGGPDLAVPSCQILPPGIPGYQPYCPFSADAGASPIISDSRRLERSCMIAASGL